MSRNFLSRVLMLVTFVWFAASLSYAEESVEIIADPVPGIETVTFKPEYAPPDEILDFLGTTGTGSWNILEWQEDDNWRSVEIRVNAPANLLVISGIKADVKHALALIKQADTPPRQIEIEVKIVEVRKSLARDLGLDWDELVSSNSRVSVVYRKTETYEGATTQAQVEARPDHFIKILDESGAGTIRIAPRVLTLNNTRASILDGTRVTYITKYSSYTNLFETDSMDAGLSLSVLPSLGESGYITMNISAELTFLQPKDQYYEGNPVKEGQIIENTVVVKDGESVLIGGRSRIIEEKSRKRFPILGHVLPFLFSREVTNEEEVESFVVLTPRVVDFAATIDDSTRQIIEGP